MKREVLLIKESLRTVIAIVAVAAIGGGYPGAAQESKETDSGPAAVTTADPDIPPTQLQWLVNPLTVEELKIEVDAWRDLLREKAQKISAAEISVLRQNQKIEASEEAAAATEEALEVAKEAKEIEEKAAAEGDASAQQEAAEVAQEALEKAAEAQQAIEEVKEAAEEDAIDVIAEEVVDGVEERADGNPPDDSTAEPTPNLETIQVDTNKVSSANELESVANAVEAQAVLSEEEKEMLLEALIEMRNERTMLIERFNVVLEELKAKGGDVEEYEKYRDAIGEVIVDVSDTSAVWTFVVGWLTSETGGVKWAVNIIKFVTIMVVFYFLSRLVAKAVEKATGRARGMSHLLKSFVNIFARRAVIIIGLLVAVNAIGIAITPLLALITAAGLVVGLALQGTLSNFASGLLLLLYRPFDVGDAIDAGGTSGNVSSMNLMSTIIRTWDNKVVIVPNNNIWGNVITNISRTGNRRVDLVFGIGYSDSIEKAQKILERILAEHPDVLEDPAPVVRVHELADSSVNFVVRPWVLPENYWEAYWSITRKVKEEFDAQGVSIPFPQRDVHFYQESTESEETDPLSKDGPGISTSGDDEPPSTKLPRQNRLEGGDDDG